MNRRQFLRRAGGAAIAMPSLSAILAACSKPGTSVSGGSGSSPSTIPIATYDNPVTLPLNGDPIPASTPIESGPLVYYNWADYIYKHEVARFEEKFGVDVEITTFNNMEEGIAKVESGQVKPDVFFPTKTYLRRLVQNDLIQPFSTSSSPTSRTCGRSSGKTRDRTTISSGDTAFPT
jgi:spermidine/putrescine-binding protein